MQRPVRAERDDGEHGRRGRRRAARAARAGSVSPVSRRASSPLTLTSSASVQSRRTTATASLRVGPAVQAEVHVHDDGLAAAQRELAGALRDRTLLLADARVRAELERSARTDGVVEPRLERQERRLDPLSVDDEVRYRVLVDRHERDRRLHVGQPRPPAQVDPLGEQPRLEPASPLVVADAAAERDRRAAARGHDRRVRRSTAAVRDERVRLRPVGDRVLADQVDERLTDEEDRVGHGAGRG